MRKLHSALLGGVVVVGLGSVAGLAAFAPPLHKPLTREIDVSLPGGGRNVPPRVVFEPNGIAADRGKRILDDGPVPSLTDEDPAFAAMDHELGVLAGLSSLAPEDDALNLATLDSPPAGIDYSRVAQSIGDGGCTKFMQITKDESDAKPMVVSRDLGNCGDGSALTSPPTPTAKAVKLRATNGAVFLI